MPTTRKRMLGYGRKRRGRMGIIGAKAAKTIASGAKRVASTGRKAVRRATRKAPKPIRRRGR
jgi:hypothetical protein